MLPKGFTHTALAASLLLGTSALALAQTHQGSTSPTTAPAASTTPAAPAGTQAEPQNAEPHKSGTANSAETTPHQPATTKSSEAHPSPSATTKSSEAKPSQPATTESSEARPNQPATNKSSEANPNQPAQTKSSEVAGHGSSTAETTPNRTSGHSDMATSGSSTEPGKANTDAGGGNNAGASSSASATAVVNLTTTQKTEIRNTIINNSNAPRANNLNVNLSVGVVVPSTVHFAPLPPRIVEIEPAWRGYDYFLAGDQIVIIEPGTRRIVAILVG